MSKLIPMEQAAAMLGMSVDQINELRSKQEIFGYKDGGTWKFKMTELERVADNLDISLGGVGDAIGAVTGQADDIADSFGDLDFGDSEELLLDDDSSADALQLDIEEGSSVELIKSGRSSDIFTDFDEDGVTLEDSGLLLAGTSKELDAGDDDLLLEDSGELNLEDSGLLLYGTSKELDAVEDDGLSLNLADSGELNLEDSGSLNLEGSGLSLEDSGVDLDAGLSGIDLEASGLDLGDSALNLEASGLGLGDSALDLEASGLGLADSGLNLEASGVNLADSGVNLEASGLGLGDSALDLEASGLGLADSGLNLEASGLGLADSGLNLEASGVNLADSGLNLEDSGLLELGTGSEVGGDDDQLSFGTSDISLAAAGGAAAAAIGLGAGALSPNDTGSDILSGGEPATPGKPPSTGKIVVGDDDLLLSDDDLFGDDLVLQDSSSFEDSSDLGSDFDGDLLLDDSDSSSELALEANESGISLSANDSGIMLADEPFELDGSGIDQLELPGDEDMIMLDDSADPEAATMMQEDDFNLTPLEQSMDDGDSSQIIALEGSEIFADESEATILGEVDAFGEPALLDDGYAQAGAVGMGAIGATMVPGMMADDSYAPPAAALEAEYSIGSLLGLVLAASVLLLGSLLAFDTCRNLWMDDGQVVGSGFLNMVVDAFGMKN